ncbi:lipid-A-disaccharide synthase [Coralloluteibacterium stylophorae]|uniref:Lipid-A-disaccharide synthase n=1 Tax=Coralloluteibacterium stylophorae TaxID=1776034 RepID=A0AAP2C8P6_9GAMM|nr:lipid-A-disaccharide synthase [Coralloluteibacterium stylophorae]MBS7456341.1 lipid-A-disaccharide synthase [Coralloluteibacterium stylophorae]
MPPEPPITDLQPAARRPRRVALVAGEASGDQLGAGLLRALRARWPDAEFAGIGGERMRAEGFEAWHDSQALAVMGLAEVVRHLPRLLRLRRDLTRRLLDWGPDVFVGIDAPDFNLGLEKRLKAGGIRTVHYVSPSVWAWREKRAQKIGVSADRVLCLFPMEPEIYARFGVDARFVGHPLAERFAMAPDHAAARAALALPAGRPLLALLPGSRGGEIQRLAPPFLDALALLLDRIPGLLAVAPMAGAAARASFEAALSAHHARDALTAALHVIDGRSHEAMIAADVVLLASGTAALEAMLAKRPTVVGYRIAPSTHFLVRRLGMLKIQRYSLPNVLADAEVIPELMQDDCTGPRLAEAVARWFEHPEEAAALVPVFRAQHERLRRDADRLAADAVVDLVEAP